MRYWRDLKDRRGVWSDAPVTEAEVDIARYEAVRALLNRELDKLEVVLREFRENAERIHEGNQEHATEKRD